MSRDFKSKKVSGEVWNPKVDANGETRYVANEKDVLDGTYIGRKEGVGEHGSTVHIIREEETNADRSVWGNVVINEQLKDVPFGSFIRIKFLGAKLKAGVAEGTKFNDKTKNYYFNWEVFVDESTKVNTPAPQENHVAPASVAPTDDLPF